VLGYGCARVAVGDNIWLKIQQVIKHVRV
jgi:hypothetical protein